MGIDEEYTDSSMGEEKLGVKNDKESYLKNCLRMFNLPRVPISTLIQDMDVRGVR